MKDVLAHVTAWKWRDVRRLTGDRSPLRPYQGPYGGAVHGLNAAIYERSRRTPARTIVAEHRAAHRAVLRALRAAPAEHFTRRWSAIWPVDSVGHLASHRRMHLEPLFKEKRKRERAA